ncbi:MAG: alkaline phosphatase [Deltaproteobacteria bacterium]|nr:alkaline phosphatase [Deltaproteobacteria bacterium]
MKNRTNLIAALALVAAACGDNNGSAPSDAANRPDAASVADATEPTPDAATTPDAAPAAPTNVIFFLGDGMGVSTITAARIYAYGEDGELTMDTLPETGWVRTYSHDALVTDSAPSMAAYMTGVKMNNEVISMSADTIAIPPDATLTVNNCATQGANGTPVATFLEQARAAGRATGVVTTTRVTHATPAATYAHICHRDLENDIAAQVVPGGAGYNAALGTGLDVLFGGGRRHFLPTTTSGGKRTDGRDLVAELKADGYAYASNTTTFNAIDAATTDKAVGLFTASHMTYDLDRDPGSEPSLAEMTTKAMDILGKKPQGYFLMVEGGRIDHALHETNARRALGEAVAFDNAIAAAIAKAKLTDPTLAHTLIIVTADHDHTLVLNGYAKRTGKTTATNPGVLGLVKNVTTGNPDLDADGVPYSILGFGNGENRVAGLRSSVANLDDATTGALAYHQEAGVRMPVGGETHGGTDVAVMAIGKGADLVHGFMTNTAIFTILHQAAGF